MFIRHVLFESITKSADGTVMYSIYELKPRTEVELRVQL